MNIMDSVKAQQAGVPLGGAVYAPPKPEVGMIERAAGVAARSAASAIKSRGVA